MKCIGIVLLVLLAFFRGSAQSNGQENVPYLTTSSKPIASGKDVYGVFEGRCGCVEIAAALKKTVSPECRKTKWALTLYQNPDIHTPTHYVLEGAFYRQDIRKGKWSIIKGTKANPDASVLQLDSDKAQETIYMMKGDDNVLLFLDNDKNLIKGNEQFSYTLNRVAEKTKE
jgi:hypothetical protein